jgi:hypothetical protein
LPTGKYAKDYPILYEVNAVAERDGEGAAKGFFDWTGNGDDCLAAAGNKGGVGTAGPVADMPNDPSSGTRKREYGGNAVRVDDVGMEVVDDVCQRPPCAQERGDRTKEGQETRGPVKADGRDLENGAVGRGISPCRGEGQRKGAMCGESGQKFIETRLSAAAS